MTWTMCKMFIMMPSFDVNWIREIAPNWNGTRKVSLAQQKCPSNPALAPLQQVR